MKTIILVLSLGSLAANASGLHSTTLGLAPLMLGAPGQVENEGYRKLTEAEHLDQLTKFAQKKALHLTAIGKDKILAKEDRKIFEDMISLRGREEVFDVTCLEETHMGRPDSEKKGEFQTSTTEYFRYKAKLKYETDKHATPQIRFVSSSNRFPKDRVIVSHGQLHRTELLPAVLGRSADSVVEGFQSKAHHHTATPYVGTHVHGFAIGKGGDRGFSMTVYHPVAKEDGDRYEWRMHKIVCQ